MRRQQQRSARRLVTAARLDADEAVLDQVDAADGIARADFVQHFDQRDRIEFDAIHRDRQSVAKFDRHLLDLIGRILRRLGPRPGRRQRRVVGIFQLAALVRDVQQVAIAAVDLLAALRHGNSVRLGVVEAILARLQRPLAPRHDDLQLRRQRLVGVLEAHLVVALAGAAMSHRRCALAQRHFHLVLRDDRTRQRRAEQILVLVHRARLDRREDVVGQELLPQVFDDDFARAGLVGLLDDGLDVVALAHVGHEGDDVVVIVFFQPRNDDGGIKSSGISKYDFLTHWRSSAGSGANRLPAAKQEWISECAGDSPPDRRPPNAASR